MLSNLKKAVKPTLAIAAVLALGPLGACSSPSPRAAIMQVPAACQAFVATYEACTLAESPSFPDVAKERGAQTRQALDEEVERARASTTPDAVLAALDAKCDANLKRLSARCGH